MADRVSYYSLSHRNAMHGFALFSYFTFRDGKYAPGQCQCVPLNLVDAEIAALERGGSTRANVRYVNGTWTLCKDVDA